MLDTKLGVLSFLLDFRYYSAIISRFLSHQQNDWTASWRGCMGRVFPNNLPIWFLQILYAKHVHYGVNGFCWPFNHHIYWDHHAMTSEFHLTHGKQVIQVTCKLEALHIIKFHTLKWVLQLLYFWSALLSKFVKLVLGRKNTSINTFQQKDKCPCICILTSSHFQILLMQLAKVCAAEMKYHSCPGKLTSQSYWLPRFEGISSTIQMQTVCLVKYFPPVF